MSLTQISMMMEKLYQGNERDLIKIFRSVNKDQLEVAIEKISVRQRKQGNIAWIKEHCSFRPKLLTFGCPAKPEEKSLFKVFVSIIISSYIKTTEVMAYLV